MSTCYFISPDDFDRPLYINYSNEKNENFVTIKQIILISQIMSHFGWDALK